MAAKRKRASYREGVAWIAVNDEPDERDAEIVAEYVSTALLADLFGKRDSEVGRDVVAYRERREV